MATVMTWVHALGTRHRPEYSPAGVFLRHRRVRLHRAGPHTSPCEGSPGPTHDAREVAHVGGVGRPLLRKVFEEHLPTGRPRPARKVLPCPALTTTVTPFSTNGGP